MLSYKDYCLTEGKVFLPHDQHKSIIIIIIIIIYIFFLLHKIFSH